jgi:hypothetical protein
MESTLLNQLLLVCDALTRQGLTPSVAMIRAKATSKVTLQHAIAALQAYQNGERGTQNIDAPVKNEEEPDTNLDTEALYVKMIALERQNEMLMKRVDTLEQHVRQLLERSAVE